MSKKPLCCGRTYLSNGLIDKAKAEGELILKTFLPYLKDGIPVVGLEPSCILSFRDELPALINDPNINLLKNNSFTFEELLSKQCDKLNFKKMNKKVLLHGHCHQKAFDAVKPIESVLGMIEGLKVLILHERTHFFSIGPSTFCRGRRHWRLGLGSPQNQNYRTQ